MCGLVGVLVVPKARSAESWHEILDVTTRNLLGNEARGRDASGIVVIHADGRYDLFKQPVEAASLTRMDGYQQVLASVGDDVTCILGHTRRPTKGSRWRNVNNHPIVTDNVIGIHNGVIRNDDTLFASLDLPRRGEVDSEIIFRLQEKVDPGQPLPGYCKAMQERANWLDGIFATLSVDLRNPTQLVILKHRRPLCLHYEASLQALFFSSRYVFLRLAFGQSVIMEILEDGFGYCFDALSLPTWGSSPVYNFELTPGNGHFPCQNAHVSETGGGTP
jgi:glucosamine 6-phosphate synthetase-like amidotransferase/phosphosugar isomerase protein